MLIPLKSEKGILLPYYHIKIKLSLMRRRKLILY
jgi:hypothetical protein